VEKTVISLGGSIFGESLDSYLKSITSVLKKYENYAIVVGGGPIARERINFLRELGASEYHLDKMGIQATRLNAITVSLALGNSMAIPTNIDDAIDLLNSYGKVVMGGTEPGHTTDAVSLLLAEAWGASRVLNITNVDSLYDRNPNLKGAKKIERIAYSDLMDLLIQEERKAGSNFPMDILSINIAMRSGIDIMILSYKDERNVKNALEGKKFSGTIVSKA
jgi:uridylate kinase